jgi:hypothetical protein
MMEKSPYIQRREMAVNEDACRYCKKDPYLYILGIRVAVGCCLRASMEAHHRLVGREPPDPANARLLGHHEL